MIKKTLKLNMDKWHMIKGHLLLALLLLFSVSCGTFVGNPTTPDEDDTENVAIDLPVLNLTIPSTATDYVEETSLNLAQANLNGFKRFGGEVERVVRKTAKIIHRIKKIDGVSRTGYYPSLGPNSKISVKTEELSNDDYGYAATVCHDNELTVYIKWNSASDILVYHNGAPRALERESETMMSSLKIFSSEEGILNYELNNSGVRTLNSLEWNYRSYSQAEKTNENLTVSGINATASTDVDSEYSLYRTSIGMVSSEGDGSWVGWKQPILDSSSCVDTFDFDSPQYCKGATFNSSETSTSTDLQTIGASLLSSGIEFADPSKLQNVSFPEGVTCN